MTKRFAWVAVGNSSFLFCHWIVILMLARFLPPESVGRFALAVAITSTVFVFANMQLQPVLASDTRHQYSFSDYGALRLAAIILALLVVGLLSKLSGHDRETILTVAVLSLSRAVDGVSDLIYGKLQQVQRMGTFATSMFLRGVITLLAAGLALVFLRSELACALAILGSYILVLVAWDLPALLKTLSPGELQTPVNTKKVIHLASFVLPLSFTVFFSSLNQSFPQYLLDRTHGVAAVGYFAALLYIPLSAQALFSSMGQVAIPRLSAAFHGGDIQGFLRITRKMLWFGAGIAACLCLLSISLGEQILYILYGSAYAEQTHYFIAVSVSTCFVLLSMTSGQIVTSMRQYKKLTRPFLLVCLATLCTALVLIPPFGGWGAVAATAVAGTGGILASYLVAKACLGSVVGGSIEAEHKHC